MIIVSSLIAQGTEFPLRKPAGFHWDLWLLGLTTFIAGILGIPFPNGLIPQAPFHTAALCVTRDVADEDDTNKGATNATCNDVININILELHIDKASPLHQITPPPISLEGFFQPMVQ